MVGMKSFVLYCEDAQDRDQQRLEIGGPASSGLPEKWLLKWCAVCVCACVRCSDESCIFIDHFIALFLLSVPVKEILKIGQL